MSYLHNLLGEGEEIVFTTRQHWFIPLAHILTELIVLVILSIAAIVVPAVFPNVPQGMVYIVMGALGLIVILSAFGDIMRWRNEQFVITDRRVLQLQGVLSKNVLDSSLEKITDVQLEQSLVGRMFNFGNVDILTASDEGVNRMQAIRRPIEFKRAMMDSRARYDGYLDRAPVAYDQPRDVRAVLEQLAALRDRGILSPAEFEAKKRELLSRI
ncbi:MAG: PH domain-containing protein [Chloroflexi bacterium]|nr:PH domain-containing protein [Chloroflexota bacterium]